MTIRHCIFKFSATSEKESGAVAARLAQKVQISDVIGLSGDLGTGKTAFARAFINAIPGVSEEVLSPTFSFVQFYERDEFTIYHFDLFRLGHPESVYELGIEDAFDQAVSLIEWPERMGVIYPDNALTVEMSLLNRKTERLITILGSEMWVQRLKNL